ncbi:MAG: D-glycero-beta-D-manno-heptose-7-phosphate kinase [bacterium]
MTTSLTRQRLVELLDQSREKRITVIGDAMLDVYLTGDVDRISPEAPVPVVRVRARKNALGGAANVAQNVVAVGAHCELVAATGRDTAGAVLRELLSEMGVNAGSLVEVSRCTTQKTRIVARSQQLVRIDEEEDADLEANDVDRLLDAVRRAVSTADAVVLEDYNKGVLIRAVIREAIDAANDRKVPVIVDPKYRNFFEFRGATVFKPNRRELESALGAAFDLARPDTLPAVLEQLGIQHMLITLGEHGMALVDANGTVDSLPTVARHVYDVVGAGDTVTAYLATLLAAGANVREAAAIANIAAGIEVGKLGAATVTSTELLEYFDTHEL